MDIKKEIEIWRKEYSEIVKPLIEKGHYHLAGLEMSNLTFVMAEKRNEVVLNVNCGLSYLATAELLKEALLNENELSVRGSQEKFEAFSAQTRLPLRRD